MLAALGFNIGLARAQLQVTTSVPTGETGALNVGVGTASFGIRVVNTGASSTKLSKVVVNQPSGLEIVNAKATVGTQVYNLSVHDSTVDVNIDLASGAALDLSYGKKATCDAVPVATSNFIIQVIDKISVHSTAATSHSATNSYPVLFPGLKVNTPASPKNNKSVMYRQAFTDTIPVVNPSGAGKAQGMLFTMKWDISNALQVNSVSLQGPNTQLVSVSPVVMADSLVVAITPELLLSLGFADSTLDGGESFTAYLNATPLVYFSPLSTIYRAYFESDGSPCHNISGKGIVHYSQPYPAPNLSISKTNVKLGNWCGTNYEADYTITNVCAQANTNSVLDMYIEFWMNNCTVLSAITEDGLSLSNSGGKWYIPASNIDGNTHVSDIYPNHSLKIHIIAKTNSVSADTRLGVRLHGARVDGNEALTASFSGEYTYDTQSNVSGPSDKKEGETAEYTYTYKATNSNFSGDVQASFLDVDQLRTVCEATNAFYPASGSGSSVSGTQSFTLTTKCGISQLFSLKMLTVGCSQAATVVSATGNTQIQCKGKGGDCYGLYTDDVSISTGTVMNTCQSFTITAPGHIDYYCNNKQITCPKYKKIIARIYDLAGSLSFTGKNATLDNHQMTESSSYAINNGIAFIINDNYTFNCVDTVLNDTAFSFSAHLNIDGNHALPDISNVNLRVEFALVDESGKLHEGGWSKGVPLTVYDPEPSMYFYNYVTTCGGLGLRAIVSDAAPGTSATPVYISSIFFPGLNGYYYNATSPYQTNSSYSASVSKSVNAGDNITVSQTVHARCLADQSAFKSNNATVTYTDHYKSCNDAPITLPVSISSYDNINGMPTITFHTTTSQQSIASTSTWTLYVENTGSADANDVMVKLVVPDAENDIDMYITNVNGTSTGLAKTYYYNVGAIASKAQKTITVTAYYKKCTDDGISKINVTGAWSCETLTSSNFDYFDDINASTTLKLENVSAILRAVETYPDSSKYFNLCQDIPVSVDIKNIGQADLTNLGFWIDQLPTNMSLTGNKVDWVYNNRTGAFKTSIFEENTRISDTIISLFQAKKNDPTAPYRSSDPNLNLNFNIQVHCGKLDTLKFITRGLSNCGDEQIKKFYYYPQLAGFQHLKDLLVTASGGIFNTNLGVGSIVASVKNTSSVTVDSAYITVLLPANIAYTSYSASAGTNVHSVTKTANSDGTITVQFELTKGQHILAGETVSVTVLVKDNASCPPSASAAQVMGTLKHKMKDCDSQECEVEASTQAVSVPLSREQASFVPAISGTASICAGSQASYAVSGTNIGPVAWSVSPASESISGNGTSAIATYQDAGTKTVTAMVTAADCPSNQVNLSTTTLVDKPAVLADPASATICSGQSTTISASGAVTYTWSNGSTASSQQVSPSVTTTYTVTGTDAAGCTATAIATVSVSPTPVVTVASSKQPVCAGSPVTITAGGAASYKWNTGYEWGTMYLNPLSSATYTVTGTTGNCSATASIDVTVNPIPMVTATASPATICQGSSTSLTASGANSYTWSNGLPWTTISVSPVETSTYSVTGTTNGCTASATVSVTVNNAPVVTVQPVAEPIQYADWKKKGTGLLAATPAGGSWARTSGPADGKCGDYTYTYTATNSCGSTSQSVTFTVENCCEPNFDLVATAMAGVTTHDVDVLRYYVAHKADLKQNADGTYTLKMADGCNSLTDLLLDACFLQWADFNNDGSVDDADVDILKGQVK